MFNFDPRASKSLLNVELPKIQTDKQNNYFICPFNMILGTTNSSEIGLFEENYNPADFGSFEKIFSGKDSVLVIWDQSTTATKEQDTDTFLTKNFKIGTYKKGVEVSTDTTIEFSASKEDNDFISQKSIKNILLRFEGWKPTEAEIFKLYILPNSETDNLFYISNISEVNNPATNKTEYVEINFTNLTVELAKSGRAITNYPQFSAPGEGYAFPVLNNDNIEIDPIKLTDRPIDEIQVEFFGPTIISGITVMGRRIGLIKQGEEWITQTKIEAPHLLLPFEMKTPDPSNISKTSAAESNYYVITEGQIDLLAVWDDWKENVATNYDLTKTKNYEGVILTNKTRTTKSNEGTTKNDLWTNYTIDYSDVVVPSQNTSFFFENDIDFSSLSSISITTFLMFNSLFYLDTERLPISITETTTWSVKNIPIIGAFLNIFTLGLPIGWKNSNLKLPAKKLNGIIPTALYDFGANGTIISTQGALALDLFRNDTPDSVGALIGTNNITTALRFSLTDKVNQNGIRDTIDLGQEGAKSWKMNETAKPSTPALTIKEGFTIDLVNIKFIGKCDYKITAYSNGNNIYESKYQSKSKFSDSAREWSNTIKLSNWNEINNKQIPYPEAITPPQPTTITINPEVELNTIFAAQSNEYDVDTPTNNKPRDTRQTNYSFSDLFKGTRQQILAEGYRFATLTFDIGYQMTTNKYLKGDYYNITLKVDISQLEDNDRFQYRKETEEVRSYTYTDNPPLAWPWPIDGKIVLLQKLNFVVKNTTLRLYTDNLLDFSDLLGNFSSEYKKVFFELNGDWPINWYLKTKLKNIKLSK